ncbi:MAG: septal ring lytic transglycosylase RlpA family protein [Terriglobales bacterium]
MRRFTTIILAIGFAIPSLTAQNRSADPPAKPTQAAQKDVAVKRHWYQIGKASWYGPKFQGKETASGETFDMYDLTAAHRKLPLGTLVRVTNLENGKQVTVRINDRGPVYHSRIIDLSMKAAKLLGLKAAGVQTVRLDVIAVPQELAIDFGGAPLSSGR